jgi:DNA mismatch repair protein MutS
VREGSASESFGLVVAKRAGVPVATLTRAKQILATLEPQSIVKVPPSTESSPDEFQEFRSNLQKLDVNNTTPIQALALLAVMKEKISK